MKLVVFISHLAVRSYAPVKSTYCSRCCAALDRGYAHIIAYCPRLLYLPARWVFSCQGTVLEGSYTKKIGRVSMFSAKNRKNFIYHDTPQRKASEKRQKARQPFRLNGYRAMIDYVNYYCTFCSMRYSDARDWIRSAVVFSSMAPSRYAAISSSIICSMGSVG